jgi:hypothetical protein
MNRLMVLAAATVLTFSIPAFADHKASGHKADTAQSVVNDGAFRGDDPIAKRDRDFAQRFLNDGCHRFNAYGRWERAC